VKSSGPAPSSSQEGSDAVVPRLVETYRSGWHLLTVHPPAAYPGHGVVKGGSAWLEWVILGRVGQTVVARGGEEMYAYTTSHGVAADGFTLKAGDRATIVSAGLAASLVEWRVERAPRGRSSVPRRRSA
jgi:hypothetical protein